MVSKLLLLLALALPVMGQDLPDAPVPVPPEVHFITFRKSWEDPPLRTNKQTFKSWPFVLSQVGMVASMVVACRNPRSQEDWGSEGPAVGVVLVFDYLSERMFGETIAVGPALYSTIHYAIAARR